MTALNVAAMAYNQGLNLIITHRPGSGVVNTTLESVRAMTPKHLVFDCSHLDLWDLVAIDTQASIIIFDEFQNADDAVKERVRSLVENRNGADMRLLPHLTTVVVLMTVPAEPDHLVEDHDAVALELARLAPSIAVRVA